MGIGLRFFFVEDDETVYRIPITRYHRMMQGDPDERFKQYARKRYKNEYLWTPSPEIEESIMTAIFGKRSVY